MKRLIIVPAAAALVLVGACGTSQSNAIETLPPIRTTTTTSTTTTTLDTRDIVYIVQPGDNVAEIARRYQVTAGRIIVLNRLSEDGEIHPGQELKIPNIRVDVTLPVLPSETTEP
jgi:LysM repeat protein